MSTFWSVFVIVITVLSIIGTLWLLFANARGNKTSEDTGHVWDGNLREYNNPLPRWWLNLFVITIVFSIGYLVVYPGLGNFAGTLGWSQTAQLDARLAQLQAKRAAAYARYVDQPLEQIAADPAAQSLGRELFLGNCAGCHGADARGAKGFPNLADRDWLYGGSPDTILASITHGRGGIMPPFNGAVGPDKLPDLVATISRWSDATLDPEVRKRGMAQYAITCIACHGPEGKGNPLLGAPDLSDNIWLYGGSAEAVRETILFGRGSPARMPAHDALLTPEQIRVVGAYVYGLSVQP